MFCGDAPTVLAELPSASVDLILSSPPYDKLRKYGGHTLNFSALAQQMTRVLKIGGVLVWVHGDATVDGSETGLRLYDTMIWDKDSVTTPTEGRYYAAWEYMFVFSKGRPKTLNLLCDKPNREAGRIRSDYRSRCSKEGRSKSDKVKVTPKFSRRMNIWKCNPSASKVSSDHPAVMPYPLARDHVLSWTNPGDLVLDPLAGSGTTLLAAHDTGRDFCGIDIHPGTARRWPTCYPKLN